MAWGVPKIGAVATPVLGGNYTLAEPAGIAQDDLMLACFAFKGSVVFNLPSDWTRVDVDQNSGDTDATNGIASGQMFYCVRGASPPTLTFTRVGGDVAMGRIIAYSGGHLTAPLEAGATGATAFGSSTPLGLSITTSEAGELLVAMVAMGDTLTASAFQCATDPATPSGATDTTTAPTAGTWIERADSSTGTGADTALAIADAVRATAGSTGLLQATISAVAGQVIYFAAFKLAAAAAAASPRPIRATLQAMKRAAYY